ncbi:hypothetical protein KQI65_07040 [bacterium]|nr:hypothetical protein [bacterium]
MGTTDPSMQEPAFTNNLIRTGKRLAVVMTVLVVTGVTLLTLMRIFEPPESFGYGYLFITSMQFMLLYTMDTPHSDPSIGKLILVNAILAVVTTVVMFGFGMLFVGG